MGVQLVMDPISETSSNGNHGASVRDGPTDLRL